MPDSCRDLWYDAPQISIFAGKAFARRPWIAGSFHVGDNTAFEEPMKGGWALLAALSLSAAGAAACREPRERDAVVEKLTAHRLFEPRLTGVPAHAPCRIDPGAPDLVPDARCSELPKLEPWEKAELAKEARPTRGLEGQDPASGEPSTLLDLVRARSRRELNAVVARLKRGTVERPRDPGLHSDLAAVYLVRAERMDAPEDLVLAYEAADLAVSLDPSQAESAFNRALALEKLFLREEARQAWKTYEQVETRAEWKQEARFHQGNLAKPAAEASWQQEKSRLEKAALAGDRTTVEAIVRHNRQAARELAEQVLLGEWAEAASRGENARAEERLGLARSIGAALASLGGDRLAADAVAAIDRASREADPGRLRALLAGHLAFYRGYPLYEGRELGKAAPYLAAAEESLARGGSPFAARVAFFRACADHLSERYPQALARLRALDRDLEHGTYSSLSGQALAMEALGEEVVGRAMIAVGLFERSLAGFRSSEEAENVAWTEAMLAENLRLIGRDHEAWEHAYRALRAVPELRNPKFLYLIHQILADRALREGAPGLALLFHDEMVRLSARSSSTLQAEALFWHALIEQRLGRREKALEDLKKAAERVDEIGDAALRERREADLAMVEGMIALETEPQTAISLLTSALAVYQKGGHHLSALRVLLARARACRLAGDDRGAEADLEAGLYAYEKLGESASQEDLRLAFLEETDAVFDEMITFQAERRPTLALAYADQARTRVLPGSVSRLSGSQEERARLLAAEPRPVELDEIRRHLPGDTTIVQFSVLADRVLIWLIQNPDRRREIPFFVRTIPREELERRVGRLRTLRQSEDAVWRQASVELFDLLVRPWRAEVGKEELIVFVPDKVLHAVPFSCLRDRTTGRYLFEDSKIAIAPSATLYVNALARSRGEKLRDGRARMLVVGDPAFDPDFFGPLPPLNDAEEEAARIAALYGSAPLTGKAADKAAFLAEAVQADGIHFAGHSTVDENSSLLSALVLAPGADGDPGALYVRDIYPLRLDRTRLVVLAACDTGSTYVPGGEGVTSFARAFLAAGVRTVVASLWAVDDRSTARLFEAFHRNLISGQDPVSALREAQLTFLESGDPAERSPAAWGAFEVFGASIH
jgi:CHAT domain-containing protein